jgi:hypothetical protein
MATGQLATNLHDNLLYSRIVKLNNVYTYVVLNRKNIDLFHESLRFLPDFEIKV